MWSNFADFVLKACKSRVKIQSEKKVIAEPRLFDFEARDRFWRLVPGTGSGGRCLASTADDH